MGTLNGTMRLPPSVIAGFADSFFAGMLDGCGTLVVLSSSSELAP
jgi:hypothetical protein